MIGFFRQFYATNEIIDDLDFLTLLALRVNLYFMNKDFLNESIKEGRCQFLE